MFRTTVNLQLGTTFWNSILGALATAAPANELLHLAKVHLFVEPVTIGPGTVVGDFVECSFNGYAAVTPAAWPAPLNTSIGKRGAKADITFAATAAIAAPQNASGYYLTDAGSTIFLAGESFDEPAAFILGGDFVDLSILVSIPGQLRP